MMFHVGARPTFRGYDLGRVMTASRGENRGGLVWALLFFPAKIAFDLRKEKRCSGKIPIRYFFATDSRFVFSSFLLWVSLLNI